MPTPALPPIFEKPAGLTTEQASVARQAFGSNGLNPLYKNKGWRMVGEVVSEPMFLLLAAASALYMVLGEWQEGAVLGVAMVLVAGISIYQTVRSDRALLVLRQLTRPTASVMRAGCLSELAIEDIVVGDTLWLTEGDTVPADGVLLSANDCAVDESTLTGESVPTEKANAGTDKFFRGTTLVSGSAYVRVTAVGEATEFGRLGRSLQAVEVEKTPLQKQISRFVLRMALAGFAAFVVVWSINFARSGDWAASLLLGLTLAMAVIPEEIPVAFSSFMALGAARMVKSGVLTKQPQTVESLGSATVICTDKTGTITQEGMAVAKLYDAEARVVVGVDAPLSESAGQVLRYAHLASELEPFDPMERAIVAAYRRTDARVVDKAASIRHEYPLGGIPPMMTHLYASDADGFQVSGKGAVERIVRVCRLTSAEIEEVQRQAEHLAAQGYRVLGVAGCFWSGEAFPADQDDFDWTFLGLIALENPPKPNARLVVDQFEQAGISVKMITGDSPETARAIARQIDLPTADRLLTGREVMALSEGDLKLKVNEVNVFARMFPEAKLRVIRALKANGQVVAMTGDGVNDGPALKAAHIGVAMGKRGTELARQAASLVLVEDDLGGMVDAIAQGRRIYQNFKKAVGYIVAIHIPIILTVTLPLLLGWRYTNLFSPVHIIFFELVMGPICSIAFENEPAEPGLMRKKPRRLNETFFTDRELGFRVVQGLLISLATLTVYYMMMQAGASPEKVRTMAFVTLVLSNGWLTLVVRSDFESVFRTIRRPNRVLWYLLGLSVSLPVFFLLIPQIRDFVLFAPLSPIDLGWCLAASLAGVGWVEGYKFRKWVKVYKTPGAS
ncbi:cation-translocating P-type ATPase [Salmonirosea aquatica]|uniref:HAD-IC family P-type ATPase n=1 Tax=Salmonirosea aquatica TaxID=2654236 RepID=A0A7C9BEE2_9BACT|nr:HAD-IC family P-type ATPase [Cytophagaceae bacterium SJW1-29]